MFRRFYYRHLCVYSIQIIAIESQLPELKLDVPPFNPMHTIATSPLSHKNVSHSSRKLWTASSHSQGTRQPHCGPRSRSGAKEAHADFAGQNRKRSRAEQADEANAQERTRPDERTNKTHAKEGKVERKTSFTHMQVPHTRARVDRNTRKP